MWRYALISGLLLVVVTGGIVLVAGDGGQEQDVNPLSPEGPEQTTPSAIAEVPDRWFRHSVVVDGRVSATGDDGRFALSGPRGTVLVQAEPGVDAVTRGERVEVIGVVNLVGRPQAADAGRVGDARASVGDPFISAERISAAG